MMLLGLALALLMGLVLGLIGGGGALIAVPLLVYVFAEPPLMATGGSMLIVGLSALVGAVGYARKRLIDYRSLLWFGLPSLLTVWLARGFVLPALPAHPGGIALGHWLMLIFAALMFGAAWRMLKPLRLERPQVSRVRLGWQGCAVGLVTGTVGAGGGFLIVPALCLGAGLPMPQAVATSLAIIALNCGIGLVASLHGPGLPPMSLMLPFAAMVVVGMILGLKLSHRCPHGLLRRAFAVFTIVLGLTILGHELWSMSL